MLKNMAIGPYSRDNSALLILDTCIWSCIMHFDANVIEKDVITF